MDGSTPVPLVINQTLYTMFVGPSIVKDPSKILDTIRQCSWGNLQPNLESLISRKESRHQILGKNLTRRQAEMIKSKNHGTWFSRGDRVYQRLDLLARCGF